MNRLVSCHLSRSLLAMLLLGLLLTLPAAPAVHAAGNVQYVFSYTDSPGALTDCRDIATGCSLRDALNAAADGDTIQFAHGTPWPITYTLTHGTLTVSHAVTIQGPGATNLTISGGGSVGVFTVNTNMTATISGVTIANGIASATSCGIYACGGGIFNGTGSMLAVTDSTITGNSAGNGGGIFNAGTLTITGSTLSGNSGPGAIGAGGGGGIYNSSTGALMMTNSTLAGNSGLDGGGIFGEGTETITGSTFTGNSATDGGGIFSGSTETITNSTFSGNRATQDGGGIYEGGGTVTLTNATLAGNSATTGGGIEKETKVSNSFNLRATLLANSSGGNCAGSSVTSQDFNLASNTSCAGLGAAHDLTGVAPGLSPVGLHDNGGPTATIALLPNSPAIDAGGPCINGVTTDQRGLPRAGINCDIGAYEYQPVTPTIQPAQAGTSGERVIFHGTGFQTGTTVTLDGAPLTITVAADGTTFTAAVPPHAVGTVPLVVTNPYMGHTATGSLTYTTPAALPSSKPPGGSSGNPSPLPATRPTASPASGPPAPLPPPR